MTESDYELTEKFEKDTLVEYLMSLVESNLVFHRDSKT
jgi:hypothetical protein